MLTNVVTRDYITRMKTTQSIKFTSLKSPEASVLRDAPATAIINPTVSVRSAKAHLSALLDLVAAGREITITSDGEPKARLVGVSLPKSRKVFTGMGDYLLKQPIHAGPSADEIIRAERDSRP